MTLEQAINHLEEELKNKQDWSCVACKEEHEKLLEWLKELQSIKNTNPSEVLKLFEEFKSILLKNIVFLDTDLQRLNTIKQYILKSQEQEKALNIIVKKKIDMFELKISKKVEEYNAVVKRPFDTLTQEEFDLLKRYFENE